MAANNSRFMKMLYTWPGISAGQSLSLSLARASPRSWFTIPATRILARQVLTDPKKTSLSRSHALISHTHARAPLERLDQRWHLCVTCVLCVQVGSRSSFAPWTRFSLLLWEEQMLSHLSNMKSCLDVWSGRRVRHAAVQQNPVRQCNASHIYLYF